MSKDGEFERDTGAAKKAKPGAALVWLWTYLKPHRAVFLPSLLALFVTAALAVVFPLLLKDLIGDPADAWRDGVGIEQVKEGLSRNLK